MMTPREFRDEAARFCARTHPKAEITFIPSFGGSDDKPLWGALRMAGNTVVCGYFETLDEIVPFFAERWAVEGPKRLESRRAELEAELAALA